MEPTTNRVTDATRLDDQGLIRRARDGDADAFDAIAASRIPDAYRLASAILGSQAAAADATQNALLAAWRELPHLRDLERFDAVVPPDPRQRVPDAGASSVAPARGRARRDRCRMPRLRTARGADASTLQLVEVLDLLEGAFERLEPDDRAMVVLHHLEGRPLAEIAALLHMPVGTVKWRLHQARGVLQHALGGGRMTTPDRTEDLLRLMLERRAGAPPPGWLLPGVAEQVRQTRQARARPSLPGVRVRGRTRRLALVAVAALVLLALPAGMLVTARLINRAPAATQPAIGFVPSPSAAVTANPAHRRRKPATLQVKRRPPEPGVPIAVVTAAGDGLRVRSRPEVSADSKKLVPAAGGGQPDARRQRPRLRRRLRLVRGPGRQRPVRLGGGGQGWRGLDRAGASQLHRRPGRVGALDRRPDRLLRLLWRHARERQACAGLRSKTAPTPKACRRAHTPATTSTARRDPTGSLTPYAFKFATPGASD